MRKADPDNFVRVLKSLRFGWKDVAIRPILAETPGRFRRLFTPKQTAESGSRDSNDPIYTATSFPAGDLSIQHAIPAIGTKFNPAIATGPSDLAEPAPVTRKDCRRAARATLVRSLTGGASETAGS